MMMVPDVKIEGQDWLIAFMQASFFSMVLRQSI